MDSSLKQRLLHVEKENASLSQKMESLENQLTSLAFSTSGTNGAGGGISPEERVELFDRIRLLEERQLELMVSSDRQRRLYEGFVDHIAGQLAQAMISHKSLREECLHLTSRVHLLEQVLCSSAGHNGPLRVFQPPTSTAGVGPMGAVSPRYLIGGPLGAAGNQSQNISPGGISPGGNSFAGGPPQHLSPGGHMAPLQLRTDMSPPVAAAIRSSSAALHHLIGQSTMAASNKRMGGQQPKNDRSRFFVNARMNINSSSSKTSSSLISSHVESDAGDEGNVFLSSDSDEAYTTEQCRPSLSEPPSWLACKLSTNSSLSSFTSAQPTQITPPSSLPPSRSADKPSGVSTSTSITKTTSKSSPTNGKICVGLQSQLHLPSPTNELLLARDSFTEHYLDDEADPSALRITSEEKGSCEANTRVAKGDQLRSLTTTPTPTSPMSASTPPSGPDRSNVVLGSRTLPLLRRKSTPMLQRTSPLLVQSETATNKTEAEAAVNHSRSVSKDDGYSSMSCCEGVAATITTNQITQKATDEKVDSKVESRLQATGQNRESTEAASISDVTEDPVISANYETSPTTNSETCARIEHDFKDNVSQIGCANGTVNCGESTSTKLPNGVNVDKAAAATSTSKQRKSPPKISHESSSSADSNSTSSTVSSRLASPSIKAASPGPAGPSGPSSSQKTSASPLSSSGNSASSTKRFTRRRSTSCAPKLPATTASSPTPVKPSSPALGQLSRLRHPKMVSLTSSPSPAPATSSSTSGAGSPNSASPPRTPTRRLGTASSSTATSTNGSRGGNQFRLEFQRLRYPHMTSFATASASSFSSPAVVSSLPSLAASAVASFPVYTDPDFEQQTDNDIAAELFDMQVCSVVESQEQLCRRILQANYD